MTGAPPSDRAAYVAAFATGDHHAERAALRRMVKVQPPVGRGEAAKPLFDRLLSRVVFGGTECWHWCGRTNDFGYGRMTFEGRQQVAHRLSWRCFKGPIPEGMSVLHTCDNASCINPEHLWLGTYSDNLLDAWAKGRNRGRTGQKGNYR